MPPAHGRAEQRSKGELADDKWFGHGHILHTIQAVNGQIISEVFAGVVEPEKNEISRRRVIYYLLLSISVRGAAAFSLKFFQPCQPLPALLLGQGYAVAVANRF